MKNLFILAILGLMLSACANAILPYDETRRPTETFHAFVMSNVPCPDVLKNNPDTVTNQSHRFDLKQRFMYDKAGADVAFVEGRVQLKADCRLRSKRTITTTRTTTPAQTQLAPVTQEPAVATQPEREVRPFVRVIRAKPEAEPKTVSVKKNAVTPEIVPPQVEEENQSETQAPPRGAPVTITPLAPPGDYPECSIQPDGSRLCPK
jgi:hypothetical protein